MENNVENLNIQYDVLLYDKSMSEIDDALTVLQKRIDDINSEVTKYTNEADYEVLAK